MVLKRLKTKLGWYPSIPRIDVAENVVGAVACKYVDWAELYATAVKLSHVLANSVQNMN